jgi:hypothetical protein
MDSKWAALAATSQLLSRHARSKTFYVLRFTFSHSTTLGPAHWPARAAPLRLARRRKFEGEELFENGFGLCRVETVNSSLAIRSNYNNIATNLRAMLNSKIQHSCGCAAKSL